MTADLRARLRAARADRLVVSSTLVLTTTLLMAGSGAVFWLVVARLASPEDVGLAGSLAATADSLALFAQLGLNVAIVRALQRSERQAADVTTAAVIVVSAAALLALAYGLLLPQVSPRLADVLDSPLAVALYCVLVAATALNVLTDSVFLALGRAGDYLRLNGIVMSVLKCSLPAALVGAGALGIYGAFGGAVLVCACLSLVVIFRRVPGRRALNPSKELRSARRFAGAAYTAYVLSLLPVLLYPLLIINILGASRAGAYFISYQVASLATAVLLAIANSTYAQCEAATTGRRGILRKGGILLLTASATGAAAMWVLAPFVLSLFGEHYVEESTWTLRVLAVSTIGAALFAWSAIGLRLSRHLPTMIGSQLASTTVMLAFAAATASNGIAWVAASFGVGHVVGAAVGFVALRTWAPLQDRADQEDARPGSPSASGETS